MPSRHPNVHGIGDLKGLVIGVQEGNTSQPVADKLVAEHRAARVRVYAYDEIEKALDDLSTGGCDAFMKLAPVTAWFVRDRPQLKVVQTGITVERLGICVRKGNAALHDGISKAQAALAARWHRGSADQTVARGRGYSAGVSYRADLVRVSRFQAQSTNRRSHIRICPGPTCETEEGRTV